MAYQPPFTLNGSILSLVAEIAQIVGRLSAQPEHANALRLRRINRIRTVQGSLAIEGNTLSEEQITAILDGKRIIAPPKDVQEARNALAVYEQLEAWQPASEQHLLDAHALLMKGLIDDAGHYRQGGVGVMKGDQVVHMAPPANRVSKLMRDLLRWLETTDQPPLIASCVFHYEFEFIHPFADGNGRMGRLWQTLVLSRWQPLFAHVPVESLVHAHQADYYAAINDSTQQADCAPFIEFMLSMLRDAILSVTPQVAPQVTPQVAALLKHVVGEISREKLQAALGLADRKSFRERYLRPALDAGLIAMTRPGKPNSRLQCYYLTELGEQVRVAPA